jgi:hypothetical protein
MSHVKLRGSLSKSIKVIQKNFNILSDLGFRTIMEAIIDLHNTLLFFTTISGRLLCCQGVDQ